MYYPGGWQLREERIDEDPNFPSSPTSGDIDRHVQYLWGLRYLDDLIAHREDADTDGVYEDTWYHMTDAIFSTVALLDSTAALVERVTYDDYGDARHHYLADLTSDIDVDSDDAAPATIRGDSQTVLLHFTSAQHEAFLQGDKDPNSAAEL